MFIPTYLGGQGFGYKGPRWKRLRLEAIARAKNRCQGCGQSIDKVDLDVHHLQPREVGGKNTINNLIVLCKQCHNRLDIAQQRR